MIDSTRKPAVVPDAQLAADRSAPTPTSRTGSRAATRVHVDQDGSGVFIYRLVDVTTGRVLAELPRERAGELKDAPGYEAGAMVSTTA